MALQSSPTTRRLETPSLFDPPPVRAIPVGTVSQPLYDPGMDDEDGEGVSARAPKPAAATEAAAREAKPARAVRERAPAAPPEARKAAAPVRPPKAKKDRHEEGPRADDRESRPKAATPEIESAPAEVAVPQAEPAESKAAVPQRPRRTRAVTAETLAAQQRDISVSEFFAKNRHLLGFDNKRKALLTTVKEAVDNSLDACEEAGILPELWITIDQLAEERFRVTVRDNGPGIVRAQIPNIFGKLLYGSKFHRLKMARGQQGIGISAAGMYGLLTTGKSVHITSRTSPKKEGHHFQIQMDTAKNKADVVLEDTADVAWEQGTEVSIELVASFSKGRQSVDEYVEQTAIANPHAVIHYVSPAPEHREFPRGTEDLPAETRAI